MIENRTSALTIRRLTAGDGPAIRRLAELDSKPEPKRPLIGAEVEGRLLAAYSLPAGEGIADPFSRTAELLALLELRATQLVSRSAAARPAAVPRPAPARFDPREPVAGLLALHPRP